jgi:hypothetical protein
VRLVFGSFPGPDNHASGFLLLVAPESFLIGQRNTLLDGEASWAC